MEVSHFTTMCLSYDIYSTVLLNMVDVDLTRETDTVPFVSSVQGWKELMESIRIFTGAAKSSLNHLISSHNFTILFLFKSHLFSS